MLLGKDRQAYSACPFGPASFGDSAFVFGKALASARPPCTLLASAELWPHKAKAVAFLRGSRRFRGVRPVVTASSRRWFAKDPRNVALIRRFFPAPPDASRSLTCRQRKRCYQPVIKANARSRLRSSRSSTRSAYVCQVSSRNRMSSPCCRTRPRNLPRRAVCRNARRKSCTDPARRIAQTN